MTEERYRMKRLRNGLVPAAVLAWFSVALFACYPGEITSIAQTDLVVTVHNDSVNFTSFRTYAMPDTIVHLVDSLATDTVELGRQFDSEILQLVASNMADLGYQRMDSTQIDADNLPDVFVTVSAIGSDNWTYYVTYPWWGYWGYWGFWPPLWGPGYGPGYPCCGSVGSVNYQTGTLLVDMYDVQAAANLPEEPTLPIAWVGALNGVLGGSESLTAQRLQDGINQMYAQSPFLRTGAATLPQ